MRYRKLDSNGDYTFGHGRLDFLIDSPATVAQAIQTSLALFQGEWFLDTSKGVPWNTEVLGYGTQSLYDTVIKEAIRGVQGVVSIASYISTLDTKARRLSVQVTVLTQFGQLSTTASLTPPVVTGYGVGGYGQQPFGV